MADDLQLRKESGWCLVSTMPDVCKTQIGSAIVPVPYPITAQLIDSEKVQNNVKANGHAFVLHNKSFVSKSKGAEAGKLLGIISNTVGSNSYPINRSSTFSVNGKQVVREEDKFWMNGQGGQGNTQGKVHNLPTITTTAQSEKTSALLDKLQLGLDLVGLIPVFGEVADLANGLISLARGDYEGAVLSFAAMIPGAGMGATAAKLGKKGAKALDAKRSADIVSNSKKIPEPSKAKTTDGAKVKNKDNQQASSNCDITKLKGNPVNTVTGAKLLFGDLDHDFRLDSALPLIWTRTYSSQNPIGTPDFPISWYGQGWDNPYGIQIKVLIAQKRIELLLPMGRIIYFPYLEPLDEKYCIQENITLLREDVDDKNKIYSDFRFKIAVGKVENSSVFYEFEHQVINLGSQLEKLILCTGLNDLYQNRIGIEYLHQDEIFRHYPSHIYDTNDRILALNFQEINQHVRLGSIDLLQNLEILDRFNTHPIKYAVDIKERLFQAEQQAHRNLESLEDFLNVKPLVHYKYSKEADLIEVFIDDSSVEVKSREQYKTRLTRKFEWKNHVMTAHHLIGGRSAFYEYDEYSLKGKVTRHWMSNGEEFVFQHHDGYSDVISAPNTEIEKKERFYFDKYDYLLQYVDGNGQPEFYEYNDNQQLIKKTNADGGVTEYQYNGSELTKIRSLIEYNSTTHLPIWREISLTWTHGRLTKVTDPLGNGESNAYDFAGQPLVITNALGHQTKIKYTPTGMAYQVTDAKGGHKRMLWDKFGNLQKYQDCSGKQTQYHYDNYGRLISVINALGYETTFKYYAHQEQPSKIVYPDQSIEQFKYDVLERLIEYRDALGRTTTYQYSHDSLPIRRVDSANGVVTYHYDQLRRFVGLTNENGKTWTLEYDANDQVIAETTFDNIRTEYEYSPAGQLIKHRQLTEHQKVRYSTVFKRDLLGQLLEQYIVDHHDLTEKKRTRYDYDLAGQLLQARNADSHVKLSYDEIGQLSKEQLIAHWFNEATQEHTHRSHTLTHLYDELGNRIETTLPDGRKLKTMYYGSGHAWNYALEDSEGTHEISSLKRDDLHQEIERTQGQLHSQFKLDRMGRLTEQSVAWENAPTQKRLERLYDYDKAGQLKEILDKRYLYQSNSHQHLDNNALVVGNGHTRAWQRKQTYQYDVLSRLTASELTTQGQSENFIQIREQFAFDPASNILPIATAQENNKTRLEDNRVKHSEQEHQTVDYEYDDLGRVIQKRIQIKDKNAFGHIQQNLSANHLLNQFSTRQIDLDWDEQNQLSASTSTKPDGRGGQEIIETQYCYDPFGRRIAKQSQIYKKELVTQQVKLKTQQKYPEERQHIPQNNSISSNQLGSSMNLSLGGGNGNISQPSALSRSISTPTTKTIHKEQSKLVQKQAVWNVWDGNRILQDYNGKHVFTTVYEADAFVPLARLVWLEDKLTEAANDDIVPKVDIAKLDQLKQIAVQNIGELAGLEVTRTIPPVANDEPPKHSKHQVYWYQNDHLGTPRELTSNNGDIAWEAVYQAWGNTVTVEWQEVAQEINPIQLNSAEQSYLLQSHRFQGQIYDVETGLHYNRFRYYDPDAGRFLSHDPIGLLGGDNNFQYAPNPVEWVDIFGLAKGGRLGSNAGSAENAANIGRDVGGKTGGAAAQIDFKGKTYTGVSGFVGETAPDVKNALDKVPAKKRPFWHGECAEISCLNQIFEEHGNGCDLQGATSRAVEINMNSDIHNTYKTACSSCKIVLKTLGIKKAK